VLDAKVKAWFWSWVQVPPSGYDLEILESAGAEIIIARNTEHADKIFERLVFEHHER